MKNKTPRNISFLPIITSWNLEREQGVKIPRGTLFLHLPQFSAYRKRKIPQNTAIHTHIRKDIQVRKCRNTRNNSTRYDLTDLLLFLQEHYLFSPELWMFHAIGIVLFHCLIFFKDYYLWITSEEKKISNKVNNKGRHFSEKKTKIKQVSRKKKKIASVPEIRSHARQTRFGIIGHVRCLLS